MTFELRKRVSAGDYFKPADHVNDLVILLEPKKILRDQPHEFEGVKSTRDVAIADIACFRTSEDVESATPSLVLQGAQITNTVLVADIERNDWVGGAAAVIIRKAKRAYVYRDPEYAGAEDAVIRYATARNAEVEANMSEVPDFD